MEDAGMWISGSYFTEQQYEEGELVAVASVSEVVNEQLCWPEGWKYKPVDGWITIDGRKYRCIGQAGIGDMPLIPFTTVEDDFVIDAIYFMPHGIMKRKEYEAIVSVLTEFFPGVEVPDYPVPDAEQTMIYRGIMMICVLIAVISALVYAVLYQYVIERRKRTLDIFRVSGLTIQSAQWIYMGECVLLLFICYGIALGLFRYILLPNLKNTYFYLEEVFTPKTYGLLGGCYMIVVYAILWMKVKHSFHKVRMIERI